MNKVIHYLLRILWNVCSQGWIHEKVKVIESTEELGNDLTGVMTLQRRLSGMERDLAAIEAKVCFVQDDIYWIHLALCIYLIHDGFFQARKIACLEHHLRHMYVRISKCLDFLSESILIWREWGGISVLCRHGHPL